MNYNHDITKSMNLNSITLKIYFVEFECQKGQLFNMRGKCVNQRQQLIRIARPYAHEFRSGLNDTKPIKKCSEEPAYGKC